MKLLLILFYFWWKIILLGEFACTVAINYPSLTWQLCGEKIKINCVSALRNVSFCAEQRDKLVPEDMCVRERDGERGRKHETDWERERGNIGRYSRDIQRPVPLLSARACPLSPICGKVSLTAYAVPPHPDACQKIISPRKQMRAHTHCSSWHMCGFSFFFFISVSLLSFVQC